MCMLFIHISIRIMYVFLSCMIYKYIFMLNIDIMNILYLYYHKTYLLLMYEVMLLRMNSVLYILLFLYMY